MRSSDFYDVKEGDAIADSGETREGSSPDGDVLRRLFDIDTANEGVHRGAANACTRFSPCKTSVAKGSSVDAGKAPDL